MARNSWNCQALKDSMLDMYPGMTVYTWPDSAHMDRRSDHNWDDGGLLTEQTDSDNVAEIRADDLMLGSKFTKADAYAVVEFLITVNKHRVYYVIFDGFIWHSKRGFKKEVFTGADKHRDHIHCSTLAAEDDNLSDWVLTRKETEVAALEGKDLQKVIAINTRLSSAVSMMDKHPIDWDQPNVPNNFEDNRLVAAIKRIDVNAGIAAENAGVTLTDAQFEILVARVTAAFVAGLEGGSFRYVENPPTEG